MTDLLFVYGTLRRDLGNGNFHLFARSARYVGHARARGLLFDLGAYPGFVTTAKRDCWVRGEVYAIANPQATLALLDEYEGCGPKHSQPWEFVRVRSSVTLDSGRYVGVWIYAFAGSVVGRPKVESGDYLQSGQRSGEHRHRRRRAAAPSLGRGTGVRIVGRRESRT